MSVAVSARAAVMITEIMYNPAGPDGVSSPTPTGEWVEIYNNGSEAVDISGWKLDDEDSTNWGALPAGATLQPGEAAVIASNAGEFNRAWGWDIKVFEVNCGVLANSASATNEILLLLDAAGTEVDRANYEAGTNGWPASTNGASIYLKDVNTDNNVGTNWALSVAGKSCARSPRVGVSPYVLADVGSPGYASNIVPIAPTYGAKVTAGDVQLTAHVSDPEGDPLSVTFFGRSFASPPGEPFRIVALPDTQYYSQTYHSTFTAQVQWIVDHREEMNIAYVAHEGDIVNTASTTSQWFYANAALSLFDDVPDLALGLAVGNHDQSPNGDPTGTTAFNLWFPFTRYESRPWYGGYYGTNNDNHYVLFSGGGMDFIAIHMEYNTAPEPELLAWAGDLLQAHSSRRGIVVVHSLIGTGFPASWTTQGSQVYNALKVQPNLMLMLCGHVSGEGRRTDYHAGKVDTLMADYQSRDNGGDGWLRILEFVPADNAINVKTYSPVLDQYETDEDSQFTVTHEMGGAAFVLIEEVAGVSSGSDVSVTWSDRRLDKMQEWYAIASDGVATATCPGQVFTPSTPAMDFNHDGHVDDVDFTAFANCMTGADVLYQGAGMPAECTLPQDAQGRIAADPDEDGDVDQADFGRFQRCRSGSNAPADPNCAD